MKLLLAASIPAVVIVAMAAVALAFMPIRHAEGAERMCGLASHYGTESGNRTATGERFDGRSMTAAMPYRKYLGRRYRVTYEGRSVVVRINDLGPARRLHRIIDLSTAAARKLGLIRAGVGVVCMEQL